MMTMEQRTKRFVEITQEMIALQERKGNDYGETLDGLKNLRRRGPLGVVARMGDKLSRLESLLQPGKESKVTEETISDTCIDMANYGVLLKILLEDQGVVTP